MSTSPNKTAGGRPPTVQQHTAGLAVRTQRAASASSDSSDSSQRTTLTVGKRSPYSQQALRSLGGALGPASSTSSLQSVNRQLPGRMEQPQGQIGHRPRQHSQGFFEPSLPTASSGTGALTPSQIAAQAAMHVQHPQHVRKRSQTIPDPSGVQTLASRRLPAPAHFSQTNPPNQGAAQTVPYQNGIVGGHKIAAATAANAAFPRSPLPSPGYSDIAPEKESKPTKERSKMKLFSKPKGMGMSRDKDEKKYPPPASPNKTGFHNSNPLPRLMNASTTSLGEPGLLGGSIYSSANASTSTLVPIERTVTFEKEPGRHKHHFLSRQKNKLKDKDDHSHLPLSSASSNSRPTDPNAQPLYNFAPSSPGPASTFAKSMSGLDLRHGGRALREKKKEEKAASNLAPILSNTGSIDGYRERDHSFSHDRADWPGPSSYGSSLNTITPGHPASTSYVSYPSDHYITQGGLLALGSSLGLSNMGPDDAWPLLKAKLLNIFEGEELLTPVEDLNALLSIHIRRCIQKRSPVILIEDLRELLETGFTSLDQTLRQVPDDRLVVRLVEMWQSVFGTILPTIQAVFLPLDLEFRGRGTIMSARESADFWGAMIPEPDLSTGRHSLPGHSDELDVRRIVLLSFRDAVILPRNDALMAIFSRLSLDNFKAPIDDPLLRPGTSSSTLDARFGSYNSQSSTLLDSSTTSGSLGARSRATSNTSAGSFNSLHTPAIHPQPQHPQPMDSARVTETVARMLQCVSVLASVQSDDEAQIKMERLAKELKYNWLGRGRTGRNRRGFVGTRAPRGVTGSAVAVAAVGPLVS